MAEQQFLLKWTTFHANILSSFETLFDREELIDVTLTAEGKSLKAHRVLLSACSPYFGDLFRDLPAHQHPVIVLRDTSFLELKSLLTYMYHGEVNVAQDRLELFIKLAEALRIKGLTDDKKISRYIEQFGSIHSGPENDSEEGLDRIERERRLGGPGSPIPLGQSYFPGLTAGSVLPLSNLMVPLEPPSHKQQSHFVHSPPPKRRKPPLHSPHNRIPGRNGAPPPQLREIPSKLKLTQQQPPLPPLATLHQPPQLPPQLSSISLQHSPPHLETLQQLPLLHQQQFSPPTPASAREDDSSNSGVVNLTTSGTSISCPDSPKIIVPKVEVADDDCSLSGKGEMEDESEFDEPGGYKFHDEDNYHEHLMKNATSQDLSTGLSHLSVGVQSIVPYGHATGPGSVASSLDNFAGPSGLLVPSSQARWRGSHPEQTDPQDGNTMSALESLVGSFGGSLSGDDEDDKFTILTGKKVKVKSEDSFVFEPGDQEDQMNRLSFVPEVSTLNCGPPDAMSSLYSYRQPSRQRCHCPSCGRVLSQRRNLKQHLITTHKMSADEASLIVKKYNFDLMLEDPLPLNSPILSPTIGLSQGPPTTLQGHQQQQSLTHCNDKQSSSSSSSSSSSLLLQYPAILSSTSPPLSELTVADTSTSSSMTITNTSTPTSTSSSTTSTTASTSTPNVVTPSLLISTNSLLTSTNSLLTSTNCLPALSSSDHLNDLGSLSTFTLTIAPISPIDSKSQIVS